MDSPFKLLAADVNNSSTVSTLDITLIRRVILGITNQFPAGLWKFVRSDFVFADTNAPWVYDSNRVYAALSSSQTGQDFTAIKLGDVNNSWLPPIGGGEGLMAGPQSGLNSSLKLAGAEVVFQAARVQAKSGALVSVPI